MEIEEIVIGLPYKVRAVASKTTERWTPVRKTQNSKSGQWEIECKGTLTPHNRTFTVDQFKELDVKVQKKIVSNSVKLVGTLSNGAEMWEEELINFPHQERRGRKPKGES